MHLLQQEVKLAPVSFYLQQIVTSTFILKIFKILPSLLVEIDNDYIIVKTSAMACKVVETQQIFITYLFYFYTLIIVFSWRFLLLQNKKKLAPISSRHHAP